MTKKSKIKTEKVVKISYLEGKNISSTISKKNLTEKYLNGSIIMREVHLWNRQVSIE